MEVVPDFVREMKVRLFGENFALTVRCTTSSRPRTILPCSPSFIIIIFIFVQDDEISLSDMSDFSPLRRVRSAQLDLFSR
jgi:hypothetical protein